MARLDAYQEKMQAQLNEWTAKLDQYQAKAEKAGADARIQYEKQAGDLRRKLGDAQARLDELGRKGGEAWEEMKGGVEDAWQSLRKDFENAAEKLKQ